MSNIEHMEKYIDHTLLAPGATVSEIKKLCAEARDYHFMSVCVNPCHVALCAKELKDSDSLVCTVIGFPLGANTTAVKVFETKQAIEDGAKEVDMVINIGAAKEGNFALVEDDIRAVAQAAKGKALLKVIIETCLLTDEEKEKACVAAKKAGADYVKTSTGFSTGGATAEDIALMRKTVGPDMGVKASGGVRDYAKAVAMIEAGASRIGASAGMAIVEESRR